MEKDSYPRFLKSNVYLNLLNDLQANSLKWLAPGWKELVMVSSIEGRQESGSLGEHFGLFGQLTGPREEPMTQNPWKLSRLRAEDMWGEHLVVVEGRRLRGTVIK